MRRPHLQSRSTQQLPRAGTTYPIVADLPPTSHNAQQLSRTASDRTTHSTSTHSIHRPTPLSRIHSTTTTNNATQRVVSEGEPLQTINSNGNTNLRVVSEESPQLPSSATHLNLRLEHPQVTIHHQPPPPPASSTLPTRYTLRLVTTAEQQMTPQATSISQMRLIFDEGNGCKPISFRLVPEKIHYVDASTLAV